MSGGGEKGAGQGTPALFVHTRREAPDFASNPNPGQAPHCASYRTVNTPFSAPKQALVAHLRRPLRSSFSPHLHMFNPPGHVASAPSFTSEWLP